LARPLHKGAAHLFKEPIMRHCFLFALILSTGCVAGFGDSSSSVKGGDEGEGKGGDNDDCKIEGEQIGENVTILLGSKSVTFGNWIPKSGSPGEYVGFSVSLSGGSSLSYVVKASGELHPGTALTWVHPAGANGGSNAPGISNVDMCDDPDSDGGGDCDGGDGCPDGPGDGGDGGGDGGDGGPIIL
jgi:hypothetical protein